MEPARESVQDYPNPSEESRTRQKLLGEHHRLNLQVEELEHELELLRDSLSWRVTAPLRRARVWTGYLRSLFSYGKHRLLLNPFSDLVQESAGYRVVGNTPFFILESSKKRLPVGWASFELLSAGDKTPRRFALYVDSGSGFTEEDRVELDFREESVVICQLPRLVRALRLDPLEGGASFTLPGLNVKEEWSLAIWRERWSRRVRRELDWYGTRPSFLKLAWPAFQYGGLLGVKQIIFQDELDRREQNQLYSRWIKHFDTLKPDDAELVVQSIAKMKHQPLISIVMPTYNTPEKWLRQAIESVRAQLYENWELCISDDASTRPNVVAILEEYAQIDKRIRFSVRERNGHISASSNTALEMVRGQYVALMDHDDEIPPYALYMVARAINDDPGRDLIFSDEDRITKDGSRLDPYHKLGWDRDLILSQNLISHLGVYRSSIAKQVRFREGFEGSQDWDFALRFLERTTTDRVHHIPVVLYHWRLIPRTVSFTSETKLDALSAAERAVKEHLERTAALGNGASSIREPVRDFTQLAVPPDTKVFALLEGDSEMAQQFEKSLDDETKRCLLGKTIVPDLQEFLSDPESLKKLGGLEEELVLIVRLSSIVLSEPIVIDQLIAQVVRDGIGMTAPKYLAADGTILSAGLLKNGSCYSPFAHSLPSDTGAYFGLAQCLRTCEAALGNCVVVKKDPLIEWQSAEQLRGTEVGIALSEHVSALGQSVRYVPHSKVYLRSLSTQLKTTQVDRRSDKLDLAGPIPTLRFPPEKKLRDVLVGPTGSS